MIFCLGEAKTMEYQVTTKCFIKSWNVGCKPPTFSQCVSGTRDVRYFRTKLFFTSIRLLLIPFATTFYLRSETYILYKVCEGYHQKGDFLFVRRKRHARARSIFFISSRSVGRLFTCKVSLVIYGQIGFALKIFRNEDKRREEQDNGHPCHQRKQHQYAYNSQWL